MPADGTPRVVITGIGAQTPVGADAASSWEALKEGKSGVGPITTFDASTYPVRIAGMVKGADDLAERLPDARAARHLSRAGRFALAAGIEAMRSARLEKGHYDPHECGIVMGGSVGRPDLQFFSDVVHLRRTTEGLELLRQAPAQVLKTSQNTGSAALAAYAGCEGPLVGISTACTASIHAIGEAYRRVQDGETRMMLAGGTDALTTWLDVMGFSLLGALTTEYNDDPEHASRPFDRDRSGFVLGEGGAVAVLEELESARDRGAPILAEISGYGASLNAYRMTDPPPDGKPPAIAMTNALHEAGLRTDEVDYVVAHGTGTPSGDVSETLAIKRTFGDDAKRLAVTSPKSMTGHATAGAGGISVLAAVGAMRESVISPTTNLDNPDPELDLDYVPLEAREREVRAAMINAFAFGGTNACVVLRRPDLSGALA
jgi:3-oxoacyl-[acyl-carrier-protein] synthase II